MKDENESTKDENPAKNWKSFIAFFVFLFAYIHSVAKSSEDMVWNTGVFAVSMSFAVMSRSVVGVKFINSISAFLNAKRN